MANMITDAMEINRGFKIAVVWHSEVFRLRHNFSLVFFKGQLKKHLKARKRLPKLRDLR